MTPDNSRKLEIDWLATAGGAFAAVSSALLLSTLGAAGTIIGAALGSVIATVGGALYSQGLARTHQRLSRMQTGAMRRVGAAPADERRSDGDPDGSTRPGWRERLSLLPWKRISLIAAGLFAAAIVAITAFELVAGRTVSSITGGTEGAGGTTIGRIGSSAETSPDDKVPPGDQAPATDAPSNEPSDQPAPTDLPTGEPTPAPEPPTPAAPTTSDTALPTEPATTPPAG